MPGLLKHRLLQILFPAILIATISLTPGCSNREAGLGITVFAAASLTEAFTEMARDFESLNPEVTVRLNFAGSQRLRSQLELGAEADLFASADEFQMALAREAGLVDGEVRTFATADMAVIVTRKSGIRDLAGLASPGVKLVLAHESVPAGQYSRRLLALLSDPDPGLGHDYADRVLANLVSEETSVKSVEQKVALGEADAGIVYRPGALSALNTGQAVELPLPPYADQVRARYPIAVVGASGSPESAELFLQFVMSDSGQATLAAHGFGPP